MPSPRSRKQTRFLSHQTHGSKASVGHSGSQDHAPACFPLCRPDERSSRSQGAFLKASWLNDLLWLVCRAGLVGRRRGLSLQERLGMMKRALVWPVRFGPLSEGISLRLQLITRSQLPRSACSSSSLLLSSLELSDTTIYEP